MAKSPDSKTRKDPARPTRAKAAREPLAPIAPALEKLLNPGIAKGPAGVGSADRPLAGRIAAACGQLVGPTRGFLGRAYGAEVDAGPGAGLSAPLPLAGRVGGGDREKEAPSAQHTATPLPSPPPLGGRGHTARGEISSNASGFSEAQQARYIDTEELREASPVLSVRWTRRRRVSFPEPQFERPKRERRPMERGDIQSMGVAATASRSTSSCARAAPNSKARSPGRRIARHARKNPKAAGGW